MVMYPVLSYLGQRLGYVQRHYKELNDWWEGPKAVNVIDSDAAPWAHFPAGQDYSSGVITVVEDWPSAEAVAKHTPACALLGTNITDALIGQLLQMKIKHLRICLDNDALAKAARLKRKFSLTFDKVSVIFVDRDPKDMTEEELNNVLS